MLLSEVFEQLYYGELSQTAIGNNGVLGVKEVDYPRLINYINLGVLALYKRFVLLERETIIQLYEGITDYDLDYDFAFTNSGSSKDPKYIIDSASKPFNRDRILKVLMVFTETGEEYILNPVHLEDTIETTLLAYTPSQTRLQIPYPGAENSISVICQAAPNNIPTNTVDTSTEVVLPIVLLDPLLAYIADRYFVGMGGDKEEKIIYPNKFETACKRIDISDLVTHNYAGGVNRFWRNGWP